MFKISLSTHKMSTLPFCDIKTIVGHLDEVLKIVVLLKISLSTHKMSTLPPFCDITTIIGYLDEAAQSNEYLTDIVRSRQSLCL